MARIARIVVVGVPHHITQRGNRRQTVFFSEDDYRAYLALLSEWSAKAGLVVWAYCLMPNHVHIIAVPECDDALHIALKETHRRYSCRVNFREGWRGYLWQGRFASFPMDERHAVHALKYVEQNPVRAGLVDNAEDWPWSSAALRANRQEAEAAIALAKLSENYLTFRNTPTPNDLGKMLHRNEKSGRPLGGTSFIEKLEIAYNRILMPQKRGRKPKTTV